jgi:16S rRNA (guanine(1405)-N(7))-methyltransferase
MGFRDVVKYFAVDIYSDMIVFINQFMKLTGISGSATVGDVISQCPTQPVDIAFLLKTIPCLEQVDKTAGIQLLTQLNAGYILVSFPIHSLGGRRDKGMLENYSRRFQEQTAGNDWSITKFEFSSELVFVVKK